MAHRVLTLYGREQCHLCDDMHAALEAWRSRLGFALRIVDIDSDAALKKRFGVLIPVLMDGQYEICRYVLDEPALLRRFSTPDRTV